MSFHDGLLIYLINLINRLQLEENSVVRLVTPSLPSSPSPVGWVGGEHYTDTKAFTLAFCALQIDF